MPWPEKIVRESDSMPHLLRDANPNYNPDDEIKSEAERLEEAEEPLSVDEYQIQENLEETGALLSRLLSIRRDICELEAVRQRAALEYIRMKEEVAEDNAITIAAAATEAKEAVSAACAAKAYGINAAVVALEERHGEPGGALNFTHRVNKLRNVLVRDLESFLVRARALQTGAQNVLGVTLTRPKPQTLSYASFEGAAYLDDLLAWHRQLSRGIEEQTTYSSPHHCSVSVGQPQGVRVTNGTVHQHTINADLIKNIQTDKATEVNLRDLQYQPINPFSGPRGLVLGIDGWPRLEAVGVRVALTSKEQNDKLGWRFQVQLNGQMWRKPVHIEVPAGLGVAWIASPHFVNRPAKDIFAVAFLRATADASESKAVSRAEWPIFDVQLHFKVLL